MVTVTFISIGPLLFETQQRAANLRGFRRTRLIEICVLVLFVAALILSVVFSLIFGLYQISFTLLLADFVFAFIIAVFGSLSIREEEEE